MSSKNEPRRRLPLEKPRPPPKMTVPEVGLCEKGDQELCESRWGEEHYKGLAILKSVRLGLKSDR